MKHHLNTLYVTTEGTYLAKEGECIVAKIDGAVKARIPIGGLESIVCFGRISHSPQLLEHCAKHRVALTHLTESGRFLARLEGATMGNVFIRRTQYRWADNPAKSANLARAFLTGKIANARLVLRRGAREKGDQGLGDTADRLGRLLNRLPRETTVDALRGLEGEAGRLYWAAAIPRSASSGVTAGRR